MTPDQLKKARLAAELTQTQLADRIGYSARQLRKWETACVDIPPRTAKMIERAIGVVSK